MRPLLRLRVPALVLAVAAAGVVAAWRLHHTRQETPHTRPATPPPPAATPKIDKPRIVIKRSYDIFDRAYFAAGRTKIDPHSRPIIDSLVLTMRTPWIARLNVFVCRTANEPAGLDRARAQALVDLFVARGIDRSRLAVEAGGVDTYAKGAEGRYAAFGVTTKDDLKTGGEALRDKPLEPSADNPSTGK